MFGLALQSYRCPTNMCLACSHVFDLPLVIQMTFCPPLTQSDTKLDKNVYIILSVGLFQVISVQSDDRGPSKAITADMF